jgi:hypothetical protein
MSVYGCTVPVRAHTPSRPSTPTTRWDTSGRAQGSLGAALRRSRGRSILAVSGVGNIGHEATARSRISTAVSSICRVLVNQWRNRALPENQAT